MTYPDKTVYPVASPNEQDFRNLVGVYLDAVFFPNLTPNTLMQEGWHYVPEEDGTLSYKGVVFNEMKGAYSSRTACFMKPPRIPSSRILPTDLIPVVTPK